MFINMPIQILQLVWDNNKIPNKVTYSINIKELNKLSSLLFFLVISGFRLHIHDNNISKNKSKFSFSYNAKLGIAIKLLTKTHKIIWKIASW